MAATYGGTCEQIPNKRLWIWKLDLPSRLRLFNEVEPYFNVFIESECDYIRDRIRDRNSDREMRAHARKHDDNYLDEEIEIVLAQQAETFEVV